MSILGPQWVVQYINVFALIMGAVVLVLFSDDVNRRIVFPLANQVKKRTQNKVRNIGKSASWEITAKYASECLATLIFVLYCYLGSYVLAEYIFIPVLQRLKEFLIPVLILLFLLISFVINTDKMRKKFMKF